MAHLPRISAICAGILALLAVPARAATPDDLAAALAMPVASELTGAAAAERFAWVESRAGVRNIWFGGPDLPARQLTPYALDDGDQISDLSLSADGATLVYVRGGDGEFPDADPPNPAARPFAAQAQVWVMPTGGAPARLVGKGHGPALAPNGVIAYVFEHELRLWYPDGTTRRLAELPGRASRLAFTADSKRLTFIEDRGDHGFAAVLDLDGEAVRYLAPSTATAAEPALSPDGRQLAFVRYRDPPPGSDGARAGWWDIVVADLASGAARSVWQAPAGEGGTFAGTRSFDLFWGASGELVFPWERSGWLHAYAIDPAKGGAPRELTPGGFEVESYLLSQDGRDLLFIANAGESDQHSLWRVPLAGGKPARVSRDGGSESWAVTGGKAVAAIATDAVHPAHAALIAGKRQPLGALAELTGAIPPEAVRLRAEDGTEAYGQLIPGKGPGPHPALVFLHGGPRRQMLLGFHPSGYYSNAYILNQHLAAQGYTVLSLNYRSGTGYGRAFREAPGIARDGASEYADVLAAGRWLAARRDVDAKRIGVWGGSWGGYLTALALARNSDVFAAGVDLHGVHTMLRRLPDSLSPAAQDKARQLQWDSSPLGAIDRWRSPVLLIHGDDDLNVGFFQTPLLARELQARGVPFEELVLPNERHSFQRHASWLAAYRASVDFLDRRLKRRAP